MAAAFGVSVEFIDRYKNGAKNAFAHRNFFQSIYRLMYSELSRFIALGRIPCKIDRVGMVLLVVFFICLI